MLLCVHRIKLVSMQPGWQQQRGCLPGSSSSGTLATYGDDRVSTTQDAGHLQVSVPLSCCDAQQDEPCCLTLCRAT